jgi:type VI secretion system ImpB/VipA family protein
MPESLQHKLDRVRPPRVQITYDVETGGAIQKKELPFVVGILADLCGKPTEAPPPMKERKFVEIDRDNLNDVLGSISPRLALQVDNKLSKDGGMTSVELKFHHIDDFGPLNIIQQVEPLRKLYDIRQRLSDLLAKLDGNEKLDFLLTEVGRDLEGLKKVKAALGEGGAR